MSGVRSEDKCLDQGLNTGPCERGLLVEKGVEFER